MVFSTCATTQPTTAVSYTHLSGSIILFQSFVPGAAAVLAQLTKLNSVTMPLRYPVSYTHLDVYKRQGKCSPGHMHRKCQSHGRKQGSAALHPGRNGIGRYFICNLFFQAQPL